MTKWQKNIFTAVKQNAGHILLDMFESKGVRLRDFEAKDHNGNTPLYNAVGNRSFLTVAALLRIGVDLNQTNEFGNTALHRAMLCEYDPDGMNAAIIGLLLNN